MKTYKILFSLFLVFSLGLSHAQNTQGKLDDKGRITLAVWIPQQVENVPSAAVNNLENKLNQIIAQSGMGGNSLNSRFVIEANIGVLTKDITPSAPPMYAYTLNITFYIGDGIEGKSFASYSTTAKGVGDNETKAYINAFKNLKTDDPGFQPFLEQGKSKILEYYNTKCDFIIKEAEVLVGMNHFDEAIWKLTSVPDACADCWNKCMTAVKPIFQQKIDWECRKKMTDALTLWSARQNYSGAEQAGMILSSIDPSASCYKEIKPLAAQIAKRVLEVDKREWNFTVDKEIGLERDRIKAIRDIGVAYGNGQPKSITYKTLW